MSVLGTAAIAAAVGAGVSGLTQGLGQAAQGSAMFNREDRERLERLQELRRSGQLGLTDVERGRIESDQAARRGGLLRTLQSQQTQGMQQLANRQALSGRELFLAQMAGQRAEADLRGQEARQLAEQDMAVRQMQLQEMQQLTEQRRARKAAIRGGLTQALTAGIAGAAVPVIDDKITVARAREAEQAQRDENTRTAGAMAETADEAARRSAYRF